MDGPHRAERMVTALVVGGLAAGAMVLALRPTNPVSRSPGPARTRHPLAPWPAWSRSAGLALAALAAGLLSPPLALAVPAIAMARRHLGSLRARRTHVRLVTRGLPDAVDLLLLGSSAGLSLPLAHAMVAPRLTSPVGEALALADRDAAAGRPRADAIVDALTPLGERALALAHLLADHLRYGVPLAPGLERLGLELRLDRRRAAEQEARRVPVRLLGPLVTCTLPAFALLTVVPLLVASLRALPT